MLLFTIGDVNLKKFIKVVFILILMVMIIGGIGISAFIGVSVVDGYTNAMTREQTLANRENFREEFENFKKFYNMEEIQISSSEYYHQIPALHVREGNNENITVMVHGMGGTKETVISTVPIFLDLGYDVIAIDQRNSGDNMADSNTFGIFESYDILDAVNYARIIVGKDNKLLLWGASYGGASAAMALGRHESNINYLILDCPVSDVKEFLEDILGEFEREQGIPTSYMLLTGDIASRIKLGFSLDDTNAANWLKETNTPTLIFNSKVDTVTPEHMGIDLYNSIHHDKKELVTSETSPHVMIREEERSLYENSIREFLDKY